METLEEWLDALKGSDKHIIVEGNNDKAALVKLGIPKKRISVICGAHFKFVEYISHHKRIILLVDLDAEGRRIYRRLKTDLQHHGVQIDNKFREFLFKDTRLRQIEGLYSYYLKSHIKNK
ncbi:MAG: toprim domain-containing protein [Candidatus Nanoarchaeia archaeon]